MRLALLLLDMVLGTTMVLLPTEPVPPLALPPPSEVDVEQARTLEL